MGSVDINLNGNQGVVFFWKIKGYLNERVPTALHARCMRPLPFHLFDPAVEGTSNSFHLRAKVPGEPSIPPSPIVLLDRGKRSSKLHNWTMKSCIPCSCLGITANSTERNFTREMSSKNSASVSGSDFGFQTWLYLWHSRLMVPDLNSLDLLKPISGFQVQDSEIFIAFAIFMASLLPLD
ncbi:hypothetical protein VNO77_03441 [Canavalia gladiata]|uniref:Uncharacterized protein n=1 Tax=Canavalia gladiata TaxID=3824 RepID=A0AAN9R3W5_CANGL